MSIYIRKDIPLKEVYRKAKQEKNGKIRARLLAIAAILEGKRRTYAAQLAGIALTNIRRWIRGFNEKGFEGLKSKKQRGRPSVWTKETERFLKQKALEGGRFENNILVIYRLKDFQAMLLEAYGITLSIATIWCKLKELNIYEVSTQQHDPKTDQLPQEEFKKKPKYH